MEVVVPLVAFLVAISDGLWTPNAASVATGVLCLAGWGGGLREEKGSCPVDSTGRV